MAVCESTTSVGDNASLFFRGLAKASPVRIRLSDRNYISIMDNTRDPYAPAGGVRGRSRLAGKDTVHAGRTTASDQNRHECAHVKPHQLMVIAARSFAEEREMAHERPSHEDIAKRIQRGPTRPQAAS